MTNADRDRIKRRLIRLLSMTVENGASEAEAVAAAEKAAALMREHNLHYRDVAEIEAESYIDNPRQWFRGSGATGRAGKKPASAFCLGEIDRMCGTQHSFSPYFGTLSFFGTEAETAAAHYLEEIIRRAIDRAWRDYRDEWGHDPSARASFKKAMAIRIASRLHHMNNERERERQRGASSGTDLVVVKDAHVKEQFEKRHGRPKEVDIDKTVKDPNAALAGYFAGNKVALNQGIADAPTKSIEGNKT